MESAIDDQLQKHILKQMQEVYGEIEYFQEQNNRFLEQYVMSDRINGIKFPLANDELADIIDPLTGKGIKV